MGFIYEYSYSIIWLLPAQDEDSMGTVELSTRQYQREMTYYYCWRPILVWLGEVPGSRNERYSSGKGNWGILGGW